MRSLNCTMYWLLLTGFQQFRTWANRVFMLGGFTNWGKGFSSYSFVFFFLFFVVFLLLLLLLVRVCFLLLIPLLFFILGPGSWGR